MAEIIYRAVVTDMQVKVWSGPVEIYVHLLTDDPVNLIDRVLNTGIELKNGEGCNVDVGDKVSIIANPGQPSKIEADACKLCVFTKARGAKPPLLVCNIYRYNK